MRYRHLVFTGPVDEYFGHRFGKLPYRSLRFRHETLDMERRQPVAVVNYPATDAPYTRITEFKHLTGQRHREDQHLLRVPDRRGRSVLSGAAAPRMQALYKRYEALAEQRLT